ncbi:hypothetical protein [Thermococcus sp. ES12]|uniref:hypothetical protein n=1 Tax=Thermococcus sp. ES12 TaxID=1638246 RepID=UPI001431882A|nr:hypothetical protein [Thermococcus sp. ES12]NJE76302.1 hypothetical protein [Thermococcus sp. ES12]
MSVMGEIVVKVPRGMERLIEQKIKILIERELGRGLKRDVLTKYLGRFKGDIDEEEWYLQ